TERQIFWHVVLPAATPNIITGLRLAFGLSFFVIVAAEFIAADSGLGFLINDARTFFLVSNMLLGAAVIGVIGVLANVLLRKLEGRLLRWRSQARGEAGSRSRSRVCRRATSRAPSLSTRWTWSCRRTASPVSSALPAVASPRSST